MNQKQNSNNNAPGGEAPRIKDSERYSRQVLFGPVGREGQARLRASHAVVLGCGGLGTVLAETLARAGVGRLTIVDRDWVEPSNLQRQVLFDEEDALNQVPKAVAAERKLRRVNSGVEIEAHVADVNPMNIEKWIEGADAVLDGLDNFETRFLLNDACLKHGVPWVYGACIASHGLTMTVVPGQTPCLRCVFEAAPPPGTAPTCETAGVIAPIVNLIASLQSAEAMKILTGRLDAVLQGLRTIDVWTGEMRNVDLSGYKAEGACPACGQGKFDYLEGAWDAQMTQASAICGRGSMQVVPPASLEPFDIEGLLARLAPLGEASFDGFMLKFRSAEVRLTVFPDGRAIVHDVDDETQARGLYAKYVGS